jgi:hypothetical protein
MSARVGASLAASLLLGCASLGCAHGADPGADARVAVINANLHELQACWDDLAAQYPGASGSLVFDVELRPNGTVSWVDVAHDELGAAKLVACTVRRIKHWRFPEDRKRRSISFGVGFVAP